MKSLQEMGNTISIRRKIMTLALLGIISVGAMTFLASCMMLRAILTQRICETNQSTLETMAARLDEVVSDSTSAVVGISTDESIRAHITELYSESTLEVLEAMNALNRSLANYTYTIVNTPAIITLLTEDGRLIFNGGHIRQPDRQFLQAVYQDYIARFSLSTVTGRVPVKEFLHDPFSSKNAEDPSSYIYCIAMPVSDSAQENTALVMMMIQTQNMSPYLTTDNDDMHRRVLTDQNADIVLAEDRELIGRPVAELENTGRLPEKNTFIETADSYLFRQDLKNYHGALYDFLDRSYIQNELKAVALRLLAMEAAAVLLMTVVARMLSNSITRPLVRLCEKMAEQKYAKLASDSSNGKNEVRVLEYSFDIMQENIRQLMKQNVQKEREKRRTEIRALQSQIRPHFLFNTLNTVRCAIQNDHPEKAQNMILALSGLLRMTLVKGEELIPLREELQTLQYYQNIMAMRSSMKFETFYQVETGLEDYLLPKLLLQPLVENCIIHGFRRRKKDGEICICAVRQEDGVRILIVDNGAALRETPAFSAKAKPSDSFSGIGLDNIDRRIKLYFGETGGVRLYAWDALHTAAEVFLPAPVQADPEREEEA